MLLCISVPFFNFILYNIYETNNLEIKTKEVNLNSFFAT